MKRKSPFQQLRHELDLMMLNHQCEIMSAMSEGKKLNHDFILGYQAALRYAIARADDIYERNGTHAAEVVNSLPMPEGS